MYNLHKIYKLNGLQAGGPGSGRRPGWASPKEHSALKKLGFKYNTSGKAAGGYSRNSTGIEKHYLFNRPGFNSKGEQVPSKDKILFREIVPGGGGYDKQKSSISALIPHIQKRLQENGEL